MALSTKTIPLTGKLITALDPSKIEDNFQVLQNMRYDPHLKGIGGQTKINSTPLTNPRIRNGHHLRKVNPDVESHTLVQSFNAGETASTLYDSSDSIPSTGTFSQIHADATGAGTGRLDNTPVESIAYCNGEESLIWSGNKLNIGSFLIADTNKTKANFNTTNRAEFFNHTKIIRNTRTDEFVTVPDSDELQIFFASSQKLKAINFEILVGSPNRYSSPQIEYYNGTAWTPVTSLVDTTDVGGFSLITSGSMTFDDTQNLATVVIIDGIQLFWYRLTFGSRAVLAGDIKINHANVSANIQPIEDIWDGGERPLTTVHRKDGGEFGGNDVVNIAEDNYDSQNNATFIDIGGAFGEEGLPLPENLTTASGGQRDIHGDFHVVSPSELKIYVLSHEDGSIVQEVDISSFYTDTPTDGVPTGLSFSVNEADATPVVMDTSTGSSPLWGSRRKTLVPDYILSGTKKIVRLSTRGKFISETLNTTYDAAAGTSSAIVQQLGNTFWIADSTTNKIYKTDKNFATVSSFSVPFTPSDLVVTTTKLLIYNAAATEEKEYDLTGVLLATNNIPFAALNVFGDYLLFDPSGTGKPLLKKMSEKDATNTRSFIVNLIRIGSFERLSGIKMKFISCNVNEIVSASPVIISVNKPTSPNPVPVTGLIDTTQNDQNNTPFSQSGSITWEAIPEDEEVKVSVEGINLYTYLISLGTNSISEGTKVYHIAGIPTQKKIDSYSFPLLAQDRLWLCDQTKGNRNSVIPSARFTDTVFNGADSLEFFIGDNLPVVAGAEVAGGVVICKDRETWAITGDNPQNWVLKNISKEIGCSSPLTMKSMNMKTSNGTITKVAIWQGAEGVYLSDGQAISELSFEIRDIFDVNNPNKINNIGIARAFIDVANKEYHLLYPSGASTENNSEIVFDINVQGWYNVNRGSSKNLQAGFKTVSSVGDYYTYGCDSSGFVYRLENGTSFDGNDIVHILKTGDLRFTGENTISSVVRRINLTSVAKNNTTNNCIGTVFGDTATSGSPNFNLSQGDTSRRIKISHADINYGVHNRHSVQLSMTTNNEVAGFEPHELLIHFTPQRKEK